MKKINKDYLISAVLFIIIIIISWNFIKGFNSYDTYKMYQLGYVKYAKQLFFADGRIFSGFYILIAQLFNILEEGLYHFSIILCIIIVVGNIIYFKKLLLKISDKKLNDYLMSILAFITIFNFSYVDNMRFIEMPIIALSIFCYMIAAKKAVIDKKNMKSLVYLLIAVFMYQATINVFFIMTIFLLLQKYKTIDNQVILKAIKILALSIIPIIVNYLYMEIYGSLFVYTERGMINIKMIPLKFIDSMLTLVNVFIYSKSVLPKYFYCIMIVINIILLFLLLFKYKEKKIYDTYYSIVVILIVSFFSCLPVIWFFTIEDINSSLSGRLFWAVGATYGFMMILVYLNTDLIEKNIYKFVYIGLILIYAVVLYYGMNNVMKEERAKNDMDRSICYMIKENIEQYEKINNCKVDKLKIKVDVTFEGLSKDNEKFSKERSYIMSGMSIGKLLEFYCGMKMVIQYIPEKVINFKKNIDFYYEEDIAYVYMNI